MKNLIAIGILGGLLFYGSCIFVLSESVTSRWLECLNQGHAKWMPAESLKADEVVYSFPNSATNPSYSDTFLYISIF